MNQDAVDDAERAWMKAHGVASDAANAASEAWTRYSRMAQGKPVDLKPANPLPKPGDKLGRGDYEKLLASGAAYYENQRKARR
jgi:hypothetical protein